MQAPMLQRYEMREERVQLKSIQIREINNLYL